MTARKEKAELQRAAIIKLKTKDPSLASGDIATRVGVSVSTVTRVLHEQRTGTRRTHDGRVVLKETV